MKSTFLAMLAPLSLAGFILAHLTTAAEKPPEAAEQTRAYTQARLLPVDAPAIEDGILLVKGGKILALGPKGRVEVPADAVVVPCEGKTIIPGLVCTHSHIGGSMAADSSSPIQPEARSMDSVDIRANSFARARAGGVTAANIMPGSGHLISGQTIYVKLREGKRIEDLAIRLENGTLAGGLKMANGTNSIKEAPFPGTRGKSAALVRQQLIKAQAYQQKLEAAGEDASKKPERDLGLEMLGEILARRRIVHHHTHQANDILSVLRLQQEFGFRLVLHHVSDAWKVASEIAASGAACSIINLDSPGGKLEAADIAWENGAALEKAGVPTAIHTDDPVTDSRWMLRSAALSVRGGMSRQKALEAVTLAAARMLDLDKQTGSLTPGKDADFVILSGDSFSIYTKVLETHVEGRCVFNAADPAQQKWAEGGEGVGDREITSSCCFYR